MRENTTGRRESAISVGSRVSWVGERESRRESTNDEYRITTGETYIIMRTIWQRMHLDLQILYHYAIA